LSFYHYSIVLEAIITPIKGVHHWRQLLSQNAGFGRCGGLPACSAPILNSFCLECYLHQDSFPTIDPRSTFYPVSNVLETPSLIDGSGSPSIDEAQGAAADVSTDPHQSDPGETVSESQLAVTDEGYQRFLNFICHRGISDRSWFPSTTFESHSLLVPKPESTPSFSTLASTSKSSSVTLSNTPSPILAMSQLQDLPLAFAVGTASSALEIMPVTQPFRCSQCPRAYKTQDEVQ
jgi:hypothetical protein